MDDKDITCELGFLFDLDGVLIDSESEYSRIWSTVNKEFPTGVPDLEVKIKGCTLDKILDDYYPDLEVRRNVVDRLYELEGKMRYVYLPGAENLLAGLRKAGIPAVMVTSSNDDKMRHLDEELPGIREYFQYIVTADMISKSKPDPEGYLKGASLIAKDIRRCVVFEDSLQGVKAGRSSGAYVVGVIGTLPRHVLEPYCDRLVNSLDEIDLDSLKKELHAR